MMLLRLEDLTVRRGGVAVVTGVSAEVRAGEVIGLLGPNGAGKTSLLRAALGLLPHQGRASLALLAPGQRARAAAWLPQAREIAWGMPVEAVVRLGRLPHGAGGTAAVERALARMGLQDLRGRAATALSGGEQARVLIARALAQEAPLLLADEPTAGLDPEAQIATMQVFVELAAAGGAVVASLHDLGLAARHCTRLWVLSKGRLVADGAPREVLTQELLAKVFHIRAHFADTPEGPVFQPLARLGG
ncbi:ABC transporter ATP-binding protein [Phaeovulum sp.]|uniref:ABC transporter ATP-binding protein n=1 Tax=Phaeovulum sp. TaxID=2934796 RepID=UPI002731D7B0|nr:ABC transporter ATP-binding protein [Phaeovulum sp.]MDP1669759.1 ABC transporter ATP-binding protein [Phaeovulum sp.]MDZ4119047.1 ABC transporter ATP-binding protein [Phaeovulum sp.]